MWLTLSLLLLHLQIFTQLTHAQHPISTPAPTTVPIFLPPYQQTQWSQLQGSILSSGPDETLYTIFCKPSTSHYCHIGAGSLSEFTFYEGSSTLHYDYVIESSLSLTFACDLAGTTAASCRGSTSVTASVTYGPDLTGPTESSTTLTLTGASVQWGVLTLGQPPLTSTSGSHAFTYYPSETGASPSSSTDSSGSAGVTDTGSQGGSATSDGGSASTAAPTTSNSSNAAGRLIRGMWSVLVASQLLVVLASAML